MKRLQLSISLPDNGGITFVGPIQTTPTKSAISYHGTRMYICANQDPAEVGKTLMAMLADLQMSDRPIPPSTDLDKELGDITF